MICALGLLGWAPSAGADETAAGGASAPGRPSVAQVVCAAGTTCVRGEVLRLEGEGLDQVKTVVFLGRPGSRDDRRAAPSERAAHEVDVLIPKSARSGKVKLLGATSGAVTGPAVTVKSGAAPAPSTVTSTAGVMTIPGASFLDGAPTTFTYSATSPLPADAKVELYRAADGAVLRTWPAAVDPATGQGKVEWDGSLGTGDAAPDRYGFRLVGAPTARAAQSAPAEFSLLDFMFPIRGKHDLGQTATNDFGGPRNHGGQDMFAKCGTPLVAVRGGTVAHATYQEDAGNYVVITDDSGQSYVYMHMRKPALVKEGQRVLTGQRVGEAGETGRASGCHLHFELWTAPGWFKGGKRIDPLPELRRWDAQS